MSPVAILSDDLVNKIAAGEVVERPASVVKELCENSIDAGAKTIRVKLAGGGQIRISVADDGCGMGRQDAILSLSRHATSKLRTLEELFEIETLGFRGEALPSIASVSRLTLITSEAQASVGTRICLESGKLEVSDAAAPGGTVVEVNDLFYNTPARRKFLRRTSTELRHAQEAVLRLALSYPQVGFFVEHEGRALFSSPGRSDGLADRICAAVGSDVSPYLLPLDQRRLGISISGFVAKPELFLPTARGVYTFVNSRYVRDRGLNGAIQRSMQEFLPAGRQPILVLFIEVDPRSIDVNVHPQKLEVRFSQAPLVYEAVGAALNRALHGALQGGAVRSDGGSEAAHYEWAVERFLSQARTASGSPSIPFAMDAPSAGGTDHPGFGQLRPDLNHAPPPGYFSSLVPLGTLGKRFSICEGHGSTLVVIDPHALLERIQLNRLWQESRPASGRGNSILSVAVELSDQEAALVESRRPALAWLGLELEPFGGREWAIRSVPVECQDSDWPQLLKRLLAELPATAELDRDKMLPGLRILACDRARAGRRNWAATELIGLLNEIENIDFNLSAIHSRVVVLEVPILELDRRTQ